jgi:hypothetical protein
MTLVFEQVRNAPQMHALVIGVGDYRFCKDGSRYQRPKEGAAPSVAHEYTQLLSTPVSACTVAEWLLEHQRDDPVAPLGSLDVLVSAADPVVVAGTGVQRASHGGLQARIGPWLERCNRHPQNVAFFFFTGHGYALDTDQLLLLDDVGTPGKPFFNGAFPLPDTRAAVLAACHARTVCFFIDACRTGEAKDLLATPPRGQALLDAPPGLPGPRDAPLILSTADGASAYGDPRGLTRFTVALLDALSGLAAEQQGPEGYWDVTTHLLPVLHKLTKRRRTDAVAAGAAQVPQEAGTPQGGVIRRLAGPPAVPFTLWCRPREALLEAHLGLVPDRRPDDRLSRSPKPERWQDRVPAGHYDYSAQFAAGSYPDSECRLFLLPPHVEYDLPCDAAPGEPV